ncbi:hydantoinase B/oxoprolinase family protein [Palleronia sediminis]|uniref:Hydantoinase B/oxoprolinase family protein n=1 Tax=Palleronia sediminis TaxID=2547833 RepID=A0A4R5ZXX4_9RHOB|nr:hydantoinase B/oxoprolinase family protein [Palleronia sediminis]TDL75125.1 hydantoinase B/oxoprolinase family protein [Palleronia sediminis]
MSDPFTISVVQAALDSAAEEMFEVLRKTAMSPIIYEVLDVGTGITAADGELVSSGAGIPSFVGVLDKSVKAILAKQGDRIAEGDVFLTNDPNFGGVTHLNDVVVAEPVFYDGACVAWVASIAHWGDIGGSTPGSMATDVTGIVAEGLRLPIVRLFDKGTRNAAVADIIASNSRLPDFVTGDLWAQVSAGRRAAGLIRALCARYGAATIRAAIEDAHDTGRARALQGLAALPRGSFDVEGPQDDGTVWKARITIAEDRFVVDLRDAPDQSNGPFNTCRDGALVACQILFKALTDPERYANAGSFSPLEVLTRPGSLFDPSPDAAHGYYFETRIRLIDMLWRGLVEKAGVDLPAGSFASIFGVVIAGTHPVTGRRYTMVEPQMGGWGATPERAGNDAMFSTNHGDTFNCPVEVAEARYGFEVLAKHLGEARPAPGERAGGRGVHTRYRMQGPAVMSAGFSHGTVPVWPLPGATEGGLNALILERDDAERPQPTFVSKLALRAGDEVEIATARGGNARARDGGPPREARSG